MDIRDMLSQVRSIIQTQETLRKKSGRGFNIFAVMNTEHDEVRITRVIGELLDPNGCHAQGAVFLRQFAERVLRPHMQNAVFTEAEYATAKVEREYSITNRRRIDLFLCIGNCRIPIEVKIYAGDQKNQCQDYHKYAVNSPMFYLTLDGKSPEQYSLGNLSPSNVCSISFAQDILHWLEACLCQPTIVPLAPIREILLQLIDVIKKLTGQVEDSMQAELESIICKSGKTLYEALQISKAAQDVQNRLVDMIFEEIDKRITRKYKLERKDDRHDYMKKKYEAREFPGLSYFIGALPSKCSLALRVERFNDGKMFVGVCTYKEDRIGELDNKIRAQVNGLVLGGNWSIEERECWLVWRNVRENNVPDFKNLNQACCDLIEPDKRKAFIDDCMVLVDAIADGLQSPYKIDKR